MADDVTVKAGSSGADIGVATDEVASGGHTVGSQMQLVKIAVSANGDSTHLNADNTNGLDVDVTRVQGTVTVTGTVTANAGSGTLAVDSELPTAAALADNTANPTVPGVGAFLIGFDGTNWDRVRADGGSLFIQDGGNSITVDNGGTFAVQITGNTPGTSGGYTINFLISAATTNATSVKGSAGQVYGWYLSNLNASSVRYFKLYNKATAPTVGTDTPVMVIPIPANASANVEFANGIAFGTGIGFAITGGVANSDTTAISANEFVVNLLYK